MTSFYKSHFKLYKIKSQTSPLVMLCHPDPQLGWGEGSRKQISNILLQIARFLDPLQGQARDDNKWYLSTTKQ
jgi:hypothetical protein